MLIRRTAAGRPVRAIPQLPIVQVPVVWHIGDEPGTRKKSPRSGSFEAHLLSVSTEPTAWRRIARLGGNPCWKLRGPGRFVNMLDLGEEGRVPWLLRVPDLISPTTHFRFDYWDGELDSSVNVTLPTLVEAQDEMDEGQESSIYAVRGWTATAKLVGLLVRHFNYLKGSDTARLIQQSGMAETAAFAEAVGRHTDLDGLWWTDLLDVSRWSAPRGGVLPARLTHWTWQQDPSC